jgi:exodeoxyribonuclease-3
VRVVNGYFVNGQAPGSEKFAYKMRWLDGLQAYVRAEMAAHPQLVLLGDFNITPEDQDSYDPVGLRDTIHHTKEEREHFRQLLALGLATASACSSSCPKAIHGGTTHAGYQKNLTACTTSWSAPSRGRLPDRGRANGKSQRPCGPVELVKPPSKLTACTP